MEGFGLVYVEASFHGVPGIATQVGGIPDAVVHGQMGLLVLVGAIDEIAAAIARLRDYPDERERLGRAACRLAHARFSEARMADDYAALFSDC